MTINRMCATKPAAPRKLNIPSLGLSAPWRNFLVLFPLLLFGCATNRPPLPVYPNVTAPEVAKIIQARLASIHTVSAQGLMILTRPDGQSVRLDAAIVAQPPDKLHLRAWKFNRTIFDLTLVDGRLWMVNPEDPKLRQKMHSTGIGAAQFAKTWSDLNANFFAEPGLKMSARRQELLFTRHEKTTSITCIVDRPTLTPRRYIFRDNQGNRRFILDLSDYAIHDGIAYPSVIRAESSTGTVQLRFRSVRLNGELAPAAFVPSPRAQEVR